VKKRRKEKGPQLRALNGSLRKSSAQRQDGGRQKEKEHDVDDPFFPLGMDQWFFQKLMLAFRWSKRPGFLPGWQFLFPE